MDCDTLADCSLNLLKNEKDCDVVFVVGEEKERISCHQFYLKVRSPVFEVMFSERWNKSEQEIQMPDVEPTIFRQFLKYIYGDLLTTRISEAIKIHYVSNKYQVTSLTKKCESLMEKQIPLNDVVQVYQTAGHYNFHSLKQRAGDLMAREFCKLTEDPTIFMWVEENTLVDLLSRDDLVVDELKLFKTLLGWCWFQLGTEDPSSLEKRTALEKILPLVRFPLMKARDFATHVIPTNILKPEESVAIFTYMETHPNGRFKLEDKLGFSCQPRNALVLDSDCKIRFYSTRPLALSFMLSTNDFLAISNHIEGIKFSFSWQPNHGTKCKLDKAELSSVLLRGPDYSFLKSSNHQQAWISVSNWKVSLKIEQYSLPISNRQSCTSVIQSDIEIFGDRDTVVKIRPRFPLEVGFQYRISVSYSTPVYLAGSRWLEKSTDWNTFANLNKSSIWKTNRGILELGSLQICDHNSTMALDPFYFGPRSDKFFSSHCIRSVKLDVATTLA